MKRKSNKKSKHLKSKEIEIPGEDFLGVKPGEAKEVAEDVWVANPVWYLLDPPEPNRTTKGKARKK